VERIALVARLKPDTREQAAELAADAPEAPGASRRSIYLSPSEVVFVIEGEDPESVVREWFDDPVRSTALGPWLPLFDGPLHRAPEISTWEPS
jgi:hypothetical protein